MLTCPHCQVGLAESPELAGQVAACPNCGGHFQFPAAVPMAVLSPQSGATTVRNRRRAGPGSSFAGCIIISVMLSLVVSCIAIGLVVSKPNGKTTTATMPPERWTKTHAPAWVSKLPPEVRKAFTDLMSNESPLYTGIVCTGRSTKVYVNRSEWKALNSFQASNHLMLVAVLPHTDDTMVEYIDDNSGEVLAGFQINQPSGSIDIVHP